MFGKKKTKLSERLKKKLLLDFDIFFDMKRKGKMNWEDIENLKTYVLTVTGWSGGEGDDWSKDPFFKELWETLLSMSTTKNAQHITPDEWLEAWASVLRSKEEFDKKSSKAKPKAKPKVKPKAPSTTGKSKDNNEAQSPDPTTEQQVVADDSVPEQPKQEKEEEPEEENEAEVGGGDGAPEVNVEFPEYFPEWTRKYFEYKFRLYDRAGDGWIDGEEFEYVLWDGFGVGPKECREAFRIISKDNERMIDRPYFLQLFTEYFFSDDPQSIGNHLNATLEQ